MQVFGSTLSANEAAAIRWMAEHREDERGFLERPAIISETGLTDDGYDRLMGILERWGAIRIIKSDRGITANTLQVISTEILEVVHQLDNQPPKDFRKFFETWFFSKPWSIPFLIIFVGIPLIYTYIEMLRGILGWFTEVDQ